MTGLFAGRRVRLVLAARVESLRLELLEARVARAAAQAARSDCAVLLGRRDRELRAMEVVVADLQAKNQDLGQRLSIAEHQREVAGRFGEMLERSVLDYLEFVPGRKGYAAARRELVASL